MPCRTACARSSMSAGKLERELAEAKKALALGGGAGAQKKLRVREMRASNSLAMWWKAFRRVI